MKKALALILALVMVLSLAACGGTKTDSSASENSSSSANNTSSNSGDSSTANTSTDNSSDNGSDGPAVFKIGICNFVDDASLNQIVANIESQLQVLAAENGVVFEVNTDNCMADAQIMEQIISNFIADEVDLMVGVATPVAMQMQAMTEDNKIPVVYAAVSNPVGAGLANEDYTSGANICGTSDYFDTTALFDLVFALYPEATKIGLLYDVGQDSSTAAIASAKEYLTAKNVEIVEKNGTTNDEVILAAQALVSEGVDAVFTPSDNTIMTAELAIYEILAGAGIPHFAGADSFALNGAFLGYGVDYANLGKETANMISDILVNGNDISSMKFLTFDNGIATINTDICDIMGVDYDKAAETLAPLCTAVQPIVTADSFDDLAN